jgi:hypothetical protein
MTQKNSKAVPNAMLAIGNPSGSPQWKTTRKKELESHQDEHQRGIPVEPQICQNAKKNPQPTVSTTSESTAVVIPNLHHTCQWGLQAQQNSTHRMFS